MGEPDQGSAKSEIVSAETVVAPLEWDGERAAGLTLPPAEVWAAGDARYEEDRLIGEGGMGAVVLHRDRHVGRNVAIKTIRQELADDATARTRFVREARLQGQLEHPAIVPVYDIGRHADGTAYFTMKRVHGVTLAEVIEQLADGQQDVAERFTPRRLLAAFGSVCLAVDFAHRRGVIHRDLKPANIMLGDYGEVYVLDWGVAKILDEADEPSPIDAPSDGGSTRPGVIVGTVGYMAPEQLLGDPLAPPADVYALGAILFEILTLTPLHDARSLESFAKEIRSGVESRPSRRAPHLEVVPELDDICLQATALTPEERYPSARALHEAVEAYLEGQRDVERRRKLAEKHASSARELAVHAREDGTAIEERRLAMQEVGRALALDPDSETAMETLVALLNAPPKVMPPEVKLEMERARADANRRTSRFGALVYAGTVLATPLTYWIGVRDASMLVPFCILGGLAAGLSLWSSRLRRASPRVVLSVMVLSSAMFAMTGLVAGPLVLVPTIIVANTVAFAIHTSGPGRALTIAVGGAAVSLPWLAEALGIWTSSYRFVDDGMLIVPQALEMGPRVSVALFVASFVAVIATSLIVTRVRDALAAAERQLYLYAWHLREFVPEAARPPTDPTRSRRS
jgi:serine/threonine-protein kinase